MLNNIKHLLLTLLVSFTIECSSALNAYLYYSNAECISETVIQGSLVYSYDDESMSGEGFTVDSYSGSCKYLSEGSVEITSSTNGAKIQKGYCVRCYGRFGCTTNKNSCSGFYSLTPSDYYDYSGNSSNSYGYNSNYGYNYGDDGDDGDDGNADDGISASVYSKAEDIRQSIYRQVTSNSSTDEIIMHCLLVAFVLLFSTFVISLMVRGFAQMQVMRMKKLEEQDNNYHGVHA